VSGRDALVELTRLVREARRPVVLTGAGVSAESGVPTFRGPDGLWKRHRPEDLATPEAFARDPALVWEWYNWRRQRIAPARPNPAHRWIAAYERANPEFLLITQNVDGLHRLAGSRRLVEVHGDLWMVRCTCCGREDEDRRVPLPVPPRCPECNGMLRPGVVWFGEPLPAEALSRSAEAVRKADLLLVVGTSAVVQPVASFPLLARGAVVVEINPAATPLTPFVDLSIRSAAGALLQRIPLPGSPPAGTKALSPSRPGGAP